MKEEKRENELYGQTLDFVAGTIKLLLVFEFLRNRHAVKSILLQERFSRFYNKRLIEYRCKLELFLGELAIELNQSGESKVEKGLMVSLVNQIGNAFSKDFRESFDAIMETVNSLDRKGKEEQ